MPAARAIRAAAGSAAWQTAGRAVIPAATIPSSVTIGAPSRRAVQPCRRYSSLVTRSTAYSRSAVAWITRSATARHSGGIGDRSTRDRRISYDRTSIGWGWRTVNCASCFVSGTGHQGFTAFRELCPYTGLFGLAGKRGSGLDRPGAPGGPPAGGPRVPVAPHHDHRVALRLRRVGRAVEIGRAVEVGRAVEIERCRLEADGAGRIALLRQHLRAYTRVGLGRDGHEAAGVQPDAGADGVPSVPPGEAGADEHGVGLGQVTGGGPDVTGGQGDLHAVQADALLDPLAHGVVAVDGDGRGAEARALDGHGPVSGLHVPHHVADPRAQPRQDEGSDVWAQSPPVPEGLRGQRPPG